MVKALTFLTVFSLFLAVYYFAGGWTFMLLVGILHHWDKNIPPMGYWLACLVSLLVRVSVGVGGNMGARDKK